MNAAIAIPTNPDFSIAFRLVARRVLATLRRSIELSGESYLVKGSRYL